VNERLRRDRSLADVFEDILKNVQEIIRAEVRLARVEIQEEAARAISSAVWVVAGVVTAALAVAFVLWAITYAIGLVWPMWAASLIVAVLLAIAAAVLLTAGMARLKRVSPTPERTLETMKENVAWVRQSIR
jgi:uncharacterized membrane protein YqjE